MPVLKEKPTLAELQAYIVEMKKERGFCTKDKIYECFLLTEEIGELCKAVRKTQKGGKLDPNSHVGSVAEELADVLMFTLSIANQHGIDLEQALRDKEEINSQRQWQEIA